METTKEYESFVSDVLDNITEMRRSGDYDEDTLEALEWRLMPPNAESAGA